MHIHGMLLMVRSGNSLATARQHQNTCLQNMWGHVVQSLSWEVGMINN